jgi:hypothetical protein
MKLRPLIWTIGLAFAGYSLAPRLPMPLRTAEIVGALGGAVIGFAVGWGLQHLLTLGRRR